MNPSDSSSPSTPPGFPLDLYTSRGEPGFVARVHTAVPHVFGSVVQHGIRLFVVGRPLPEGGPKVEGILVETVFKGQGNEEVPRAYEVTPLATVESLAGWRTVRDDVG